MSLSEAFGRVSREHDEQFLEVMADAPDPEPEDEVVDAPPPPVTGEVPAAPVVEPPSAPAEAAVSKRPTNRPVAPSHEDVSLIEERADEGRTTGPSVVSPPEGGSSAEAVPSPEIPLAAAPPSDLEGVVPAETDRPDGIAATAEGLLQTEAERAAEIAQIRIRGSVIDGGSAQDMLDGKHPAPSVMSQREIDRMNRLRSLGLDLTRPHPWPDFMPYPSEAELRELTHPDTTPEMIRAFEVAKQKEADDMAVRAAEINDWIFRSGTMRLNEEAQMRRAARRDSAVAERNRGRRPEDRIQNEFTADDVSDLDLYGDHFYGVRFAMLLNPDPANVTRLRTAPVAAWGHDRLITLDGGRIRARDNELIVTSISAQAAQMLVMEAKARGWETLRVSGDNEFCAAVKRAAKEAGMGAILHRRGPLGIGPFSRPEVIMPPVPRSRIPVGVDQNGAGTPDKTRKEAEAAAPVEDVEAAKALRQLERNNREPRAARDRTRVTDPLRAPNPAGQTPGDPAPGDPAPDTPSPV